MVSARVLNPVLSEFCKMSASPGVSRNLHYGRQLERIKRNLFGPTPANLMETKTPFNAELERHQEMATQKWGFDFRTDRPLGANGSFIWERVSSQESTFAPQMYTLTRAAHVRSDANDSAMPSDMDTLLNERADRENLANSSLDSNTDNEYDSQNESAASTSAAALTASTSTSCNYSTQQRKRQLKITEFMKERKRLPQAPKKISPAKRMRTSSGSHSSSSSSSSSSRISSSLGAQFGCLLKRSRHDN
ncbi:hypothetical protein ACLKA7_000240 [Drosophila subpalustris]